MVVADSCCHLVEALDRIKEVCIEMVESIEEASTVD
jgi:hypothetical protein